MWISLLAIGLLALLGVAAIVRPDAQGRGTHQQFGLPPCTFRVVFGLPCPTCGMTTAWAYLVRGELGSAFAANVGGALTGMLAVALVPWLLCSAAWGRWLGRALNSKVVGWMAVGITLVTLIDWSLRLLAR